MIRINNLFKQFKFADFFLKLYRGDLRNLTAYKFQPQKPIFYPVKNSNKMFKYCTPEHQGINSKHIEQLYKTLINNKYSNTHSILILRNNYIISEGHFKPYNKEYRHFLYSISKTIVGLAVGIAINEGYLSLDDKVKDIFPEYSIKANNPNANYLNIYHLLTMTSGVSFNEIGSIITENWIKSFIESDFLFKPGQKFNYNSMNTYILSAIICKKTGMSLVEFLKPRLFEPLGIKDVFWEKCPLNIEKGGWGLSLTSYELAKFGQLFLQNGVWNGQQIIPQNWIHDSVKHHVKTEFNALCQFYGYQIWSFPIEGAYQFNGMFGQYVLVIPKYNMVVVVTSGNSNIFPEGSTLEILYKFLTDNNLFTNNSLLQNISSYKKLINTTKHLSTIKKSYYIPDGYIYKIINILQKIYSSKNLYPQELKYNNNLYKVSKNNASILPIILQCTHNNFNEGINKILLSFSKSSCTINISEGNTVYSISAGKHNEYLYNTLNFNGEYYKVASTSMWSINENDEDILKIFISFIETPNTRILTFIFSENNIIIKLSETPNPIDSIYKVFQFNKIIKLRNASNLSENMLNERFSKIIFSSLYGTLYKTNFPSDVN